MNRVAPSELLDLRRRLGLFQWEMAALLDVTRLTYLRWENGQREPFPGSRRRIDALMRSEGALAAVTQSGGFQRRPGRWRRRPLTSLEHGGAKDQLKPADRAALARSEGRDDAGMDKNAQVGKMA